MNRALQLILLTAFAASSCAGGRLAHNEIRRKVAELGSSTLIPEAVQVRRIVSESDKRVVAETTVDLAVQLERDTTGSPWHVTSIRLGDQNWISTAELLAAINELRLKETTASLRKLDAGVAAFRQRNGSAPTATTIVTLGDALHPGFMADLVISDAWGRPIEIESTAPAFRFRSLGVDGQRGTADDVRFP